jgi:hypothetical protein
MAGGDWGGLIFIHFDKLKFSDFLSPRGNAIQVPKNLPKGCTMGCYEMNNNILQYISSG